LVALVLSLFHSPHQQILLGFHPLPVSCHPPNYEGDSADIVSSARFTAMQILGDRVSPPYHHVHARTSSSPIPVYMKAQILVDAKRTSPKKTSSAHWHATLRQVEHCVHLLDTTSPPSTRSAGQLAAWTQILVDAKRTLPKKTSSAHQHTTLHQVEHRVCPLDTTSPPSTRSAGQLVDALLFLLATTNVCFLNAPPSPPPLSPLS